MDHIDSVIAPLDMTVKEGWKRLGENGHKVLFVVNDRGEICGSLTDGDVRRWILAEQSMLAPIAEALKKDPIVLSDDYHPDDAKKIMLEHQLACLPIVDAKGKLKGLLSWNTLFESTAEAVSGRIDMPVVIMAGGQGMRLDPFTRVLPKPLIPIGDKPILEIIIEKFRAFDVNEFYLSVNYRSSMIKAYFQDLALDYRLHYVEEKTPCGTAGSLSMLAKTIHTTFIVSNCDIIIDADYADIVKFHRDNKNKITLVCSMKHFPIPYGVVEIENGGTLKGIWEKPEFDRLVLTGLYIVEPELLSLIPADQVFHMTHLIEKLRLEKQKIGVYPVSERAWMDIGELGAYQKMLGRLHAV